MPLSLAFFPRPRLWSYTTPRKYRARFQKEPPVFPLSNYTLYLSVYHKYVCKTNIMQQTIVKYNTTTISYYIIQVRKCRKQSHIDIIWGFYVKVERTILYIQMLLTNWSKIWRKKIQHGIRPRLINLTYERPVTRSLFMEENSDGGR